MYIVKDKRGNKLLALHKGNEGDVVSNKKYRPLTSSLVIVKSLLGFMLLKNRYRNEWELAGGMIEEHETPMECAIRECYEESGYKVDKLRFIGIMEFYLLPSFHLPEERIEYTTLYCADIDNVKDFIPNDEMTELCWYNFGDKIENANAIDLKLLEYYK